MAQETEVSSVWGRRDFRHKILAYNQLAESGRYKAVFNAQTFKVLTLTTSEERAANLKKMTEEAGGSRYWFTSFDRFDKRGGSFADVLTAQYGILLLEDAYAQYIDLLLA